ncbi:MAG: aminopeptidase P family protein [Erythrobacter sp.]|jgi:Xaa-Pro aminopeptidase|uniref:aminopeptidase P family protein n=1 Tax=Qipengyuania citrea TaxID=225971 RepID=UPI001A39D297|nr:aminopeptidase P family protein [Qipengyuania citrea]MBL4719367.1 aminopeptidase P family protein [Erythrobacter sp.]MCP2018271.1 Xaa-Pro aminopeptidase [Qipengyuania citrea]MDE0901796.1 aminopeptidase P family protein [Erythrobacter sp.]
MLMQTHEARLDGLRKELARRGLDGFVIPISDEHMSEYVGSYAQRLNWLTGFGGSAGSAAVLQDRAAMFTDGRYTVQVREQVSGALYDYEDVPATSPAKWIAEHAPEGAKIGYDAWLHGIGWAEEAEAAFARKGIELVPVDGNPIDAIWDDRPQASLAAAVPHGDEHAGRSSADKRSEVADWLKQEGYDATVVSALDSVAWLLNMRGSDVDNTPVALSYVLAHADGTAELFIAPDKVTPELTQHLGNAVTVRDRAEFVPALEALDGKRVAVDPNHAVAGIFHALEQGGASVVRTDDPTVLPKAIKNPAEQQGHRDAQSRDGAAVARFLRWLGIEAPKGGVDELAAAAKLREFREAGGLLKDASFDTISAAAGHAALPHYKVDEDSNIPIPPSSIYLVDSGGQYLDGTTDITRTVWIGPGEPSAEMVERNTRVLKGHIQLDMQKFPDRTTGGALDALARMHLWNGGVDYGHGTGHGVGSFLSVHEGPQRISKPGGAFPGTETPLREGMILSNEPGYYKPGEYGIRIENLVLVVDAGLADSEGKYLGFETLTMVPLDRTLVDPALLSEAEIGWWNDYHTAVYATLAPQLEGDDLAWLEEQCAPL